MSKTKLQKEIFDIEFLIGKAISRQESQAKVIELLREKIAIIKRYLNSI